MALVFPGAIAPSGAGAMDTSTDSDRRGGRAVSSGSFAGQHVGDGPFHRWLTFTSYARFATVNIPLWSLSIAKLAGWCGANRDPIVSQRASALTMARR